MGTALAHEPITTQLTWTHEISRLIDRHCAGCHQPAGQAMSLLTYTEARPWAKAIRDEVLSRRMPPWDAVKGVGDFRNDASLTQPEMDFVVRWVEGGAPEGDPLWLAGRRTVPKTAPVKPVAPFGIQVRNTQVLRRPLLLTGIWAEGPVEVTALLPGQSVQRLLWIREFHNRWNRIYTLRSPLLLPRGTSILVRSAKPAAITLISLNSSGRNSVKRKAIKT